MSAAVSDNNGRAASAALLASALEFAELGCRVVIVRGKDPGAYLGREWQLKATRDEETLRGWWSRWPDGNVGVVGDGPVLPLDVDNPESFERFQEKYGHAPPTPRYYTGGAHPPGRERLLFKHPGMAVEAKLADGVQLRRGNMMSLVPPSVHPETGVTSEYTIGLDEAPFAAVPAAWIERARPAQNGAGKPQSHWAELVVRHYRTGCGQTHPDVVSLAAYLVKKLGSGRIALELLLGWNERHCHPPKPEQEIVDIVAWAVRKETGR
jgi:hypothetical protein